MLETLPSSINPIYTTHILLGLRQSTTPEQSLRAAWAARTQLSTSAVQIGQLIERAAPHVDAALFDAARVTEHDLLELLRRLLDQPPPALAGTAAAQRLTPAQSRCPPTPGSCWPALSCVTCCSGCAGRGTTSPNPLSPA
jgi:hypothetical protein